MRDMGWAFCAGWSVSWLTMCAISKLDLAPWQQVLLIIAAYVLARLALELIWRDA